MSGYSLMYGDTAIECATCGWISHNANDVKHRYCGHCHKFHEDTMSDWNREQRNADLRALDLPKMQALFPSADPEVLLAALHKARYDCRAIEDELRLVSAEWLRSRGMTAIGGVPLLPPGELPRGIL